MEGGSVREGKQESERNAEKIKSVADQQSWDMSDRKNMF
jgi:hypothetical protein